jgi:AcrR family transcriptional regulator
MNRNVSTLKRLREEEREARRNLIIDAAIRLFARMPFSQVGVRDIAAEAGLSAASIYRYFENRDELFVEALLREIKAIEESFELSQDDTTTLTIEKVAETFVQYLLDHDGFFQMMAHFMINGGIREKSLERFNAAERKLLDIVEQVFIRMGASGNVRVITHAFFASLNGILITFHNYPGRNPEETRKHARRLAGIIADMFRKGIA